MSDRYAALFGRLARRAEGAFIPFAMLGDPSPAAGASILAALEAGGADALELGLPFSDPVADGPVIQAAACRALAAGTRIADCWPVIAGVRAAHPGLPIGLLVYANLALHAGLDRFYGAARDAGVDSVLVADAPLDEAGPFEAAAARAGIAPVLIAPPNADPSRLARIAARARGFTYVTTRAGVTGADDRDHRGLAGRLAELRRLGAPPPVLGFGIATPAQVRSAMDAGAAGAISGSAVVRLAAAHADDPAARDAALRELVAAMKAATRRCPVTPAGRD